MKNIAAAADGLQKSERNGGIFSLETNAERIIKRCGVIIFLIITLFSGMIFGAVGIMKADDTVFEKIQPLFSVFINTKNNVPPIRVFVNSFTISFLFAALLYISSFSLLGIPRAVALLFLQGARYGILSGILCMNYGLKGLLFYLTVNLSGGFLSSAAIVYQSQYCVDFSLALLLETIGKRKPDSPPLRNKAAELSLNSCFVIMAIIFASLTDTLLFFLAGGLFKL